ncbi:MAG: hypothetical protein AAF264_01465 [Pseudomonadota bacterium]
MLRLLLVLVLSAPSAAAQETRSYTDGLDRVVEIPVEPKRI